MKNSKFLCFILATVMIVSMIPMTVHISAATVNGFVYTISNGEVTITDYTGSAKNMVIPETIEGCPVTKIGYYAFYSTSNLVSVVIPETVNEIDESAFRKCEMLKSVVFYNSIPKILSYVFFGCARLESVYYVGTREDWNKISISDSAGAIKNNDVTIYYCDKYAQTPEGIAYVISEGRAIVTSYLGSSGEVVVPDAFDDCHVTLLGVGSFCKNTVITSVVLPDTITELGTYSFYECTNLTELTLPSGLTTIGEYAFSSCRNLKQVYYCGSEEQWNAITVGSNNDYLLNANLVYVRTISGDIDTDGFLTAMDVNLAKRLVCGSLTGTAKQIEFADVNGDGVFNGIDINILSRAVAGAGEQ